MKQYLRKIRWLLMGDFTFQVFGDVALAFLPITSKLLFDKAAGTGEWRLGTILLLFLLCVAVYIASSYFSMLFAWRHSIRLETDLRKDYFLSLLKRPFRKFYSRDIGEYISFQANDIQSLSQDYTPPIINLAKSILMFFVYAVILVVLIDWRVALTLLAASVLCVFLTHLTSKSLGKTRRQFLEIMAQYTATLKDLLLARKKISSRTLRNIVRRHDGYIADAADSRFAFGKMKTRSLALNGLFTYLINISAFLVVALLLLNQRIGVGSAVASLAYIECFVSPLKDILYDLTALRSVKETAEKVEEEVVADAAAEADMLVKNTLSDSLVLHNLNFTNGEFHLGECSYTFEHNKKYAIIGANGSGKTTLFNLIMKRILPESGEIYADGRSLREIDIAYLAGILDQDEHIFAADLAGNVSVFGSYDSTTTMKMIPRLSLGQKDTVTHSENMQNTSGGEQRLIGILRLFSQNTPILLLDEPFASLDENTAKEIGGILAHASEKTILMITHDLSETFLKTFDAILIMKAGRIVASGAYRDICQTTEFQTLLTSAGPTTDAA